MYQDWKIVALKEVLTILTPGKAAWSFLARIAPGENTTSPGLFGVCASGGPGFPADMVEERKMKLQACCEKGTDWQQWNTSSTSHETLSVALLGSQGARRLSGNAEQFLPALEISTCIQTQHWTSQLTRPCSGIWNSHVCTALIPQHIVLKDLGLLDCFPKASQVAASYPQKEGGKSQQYQLLYTSCKAIPAFDGWRAAWDPPLAELFLTSPYLTNILSWGQGKSKQLEILHFRYFKLNMAWDTYQWKS